MAKKATPAATRKAKPKAGVGKGPAKKAAPAKSTRKTTTHLASKAKAKAKSAAVTKAKASAVTKAKPATKKAGKPKAMPTAKPKAKPASKSKAKPAARSKEKVTPKPTAKAAKPVGRAAAKKAVRTVSKRHAVASAKSKPITILVGTRKGAFFLRSDVGRDEWTISKPLFLGHIIYHMVSDPRGSGVIVMGAKTGHLGPTVLRSTDNGKTWVESTKPPAFTKHDWEEKGRSVENVFWISPGHDTEPGVWYAGTSPPGLFRSEDHGDTWTAISGFNENNNYGEWFKMGPTPGGQMVHSVRIDPRDPQHIYLGVSVGGIFETFDGGHAWRPLNKGVFSDFMPDPETEYGHDPHCVIIHPLQPDRLYQQNHCGIYSMERSEERWVRIGDNMPKAVGDIGFPIIAHPRDHECIWVFPMDGTQVWPRTSPAGKPCTFNSRNGGKTWKKQNKGLPESDAYFTVKRQAMTSDDREPLGLYFGTTGGEVWGSSDEGESWTCLVRYLPEIYSLTILEG